MGSEAKIKVGGIMANRVWPQSASFRSRTDRMYRDMILHAMGRQNINIEFVVHNIDIEGNGNMTFCIDQKDLEAALEVLERSQTLGRGKGDLISSQCGDDQRLRPSLQREADDLRLNV